MFKLVDTVGIGEGKVNVYYDDGQVAVDQTFKNGKLDGSYKEYYKGNKPKVTATYVNGKEEGEYTVYYESGQKQVVSKFKEGLPEGEWVYYYQNGKESKKMNFVKGLNRVNIMKAEIKNLSLNLRTEKSQEHGRCILIMEKYRRHSRIWTDS